MFRSQATLALLPIYMILSTRSLIRAVVYRVTRAYKEKHEDVRSMWRSFSEAKIESSITKETDADIRVMNTC